MAPTYTRFSSISATSTSTNPSSRCDPNQGKKFACDFSGCGKCFSRSEHLHRHALNHKDGNNTCLRCMAHFRRRDLLDRHMARHKEKDDEAGGEGLGILATRKKLWRDAEGNIVNARRPSSTHDNLKRKLVRKPEKKDLDQKSSLSEDRGPTFITTSIAGNQMLGLPDENKTNQLSQSPWLEMSAQNSAPISEINAENRVPDSRETLPENLVTLYENPWPIIQNHQPEIFNHNPVIERQQPEFSTSSGWGCSRPFQTFMGSMGEAHPEEIFKTESGLYGWQAWNSQLMMSRCREEKFEALEDRRRDLPANAAQNGMCRRGFGLSI